MSYQTKNAILFIIFNRTKQPLKVLEQIKKVQPTKMYIVADGPRQHIAGEKEKCLEVRRLVEEAIDWECEVITNYSEENLGCGKRLSSGISWGFEQEEQLIIIEDDIFCSENFFRYCDYYLAELKSDKSIYMISGCNLIQDYSVNYPNVFLSKFGGIWGWAGWRDRWQGYDLNIDSSVINKANILDSLEKEYWRYYLNLAYLGKLNTWDYQWDAFRYLANGLVLVPKRNLTKNIGFDGNSTHTFTEDEAYSGFGLWEEDLHLISPSELERLEAFENWYVRKIIHHSLLHYFKILIRNILTGVQKSLKKFSI